MLWDVTGIKRGDTVGLSELASLRVDDVDLEHRILTVQQGKGKKDRQIPLVDDAVKALRNYMRYRNTQLILLKGCTKMALTPL